MRRTKIVCTVGPASESPEVLEALIQAGLDVARLNFSHGTHEEHALRIARIREASAKVGKRVALMLDIKGPKIRTGRVRGGQVELQDGAELILTTEPVEGTAERISVSYTGLPEDVSPGSIIRIDDGLIGLKVIEVHGGEIRCRVTNGGILRDHKGINAPGVKLRLPGVTEKDVADIRFGIAQGVDMIAASFVRKAGDVLEIRRLLEEAGVHMDIIAKIEAQEALDSLEEILGVSDGLMVARGDLGVEIATEEVPLWQKRMIELCNRAGKPVITATQMLDSMQRNPRPTRAEASDVANAIFDGTDAIMLSGETAAGKYPVESVKTMARIAERAEEALWAFRRTEVHKPQGTVTDAISYAVAALADDLKAAAVLTSTQSGLTARRVSKYRPRCPIVAVTPREDVARRLALCWGVYPTVARTTKSTDEMLEVAIDAALETGIVKHGDLVVITAGVPVGQPGTTNLLKVHTIGDVAARGQGIGRGAVTGRAVVVRRVEDAARVQAGDVVVTVATDADLMSALERAAAIIAEEGGLTSHAAVVGLSLGIPVVVGVERATETLRDGEVVTVDAELGLIYRGRARVL
ncbi:pyruvate kinase [Kyrpidia spormannii]|uniref:Pyruvate kinase n=2 Tax=Kyrpidia spormannii TaxID=2055160 RepID=A0A6F9EDB2_9BACL|nr:pyruvate kinase [Kyrpidia spormannii]CAB3393945.1 pyruvate kinase [Kyrpidia spormannii]CAB3394867.1 pyruvate kinase [Kyrpidia spormannii]